jgi:hypothetical protein
MENRGIVKISQVGHILAFFVFGWIDLSNEILLEILGLFLSFMGFVVDARIYGKRFFLHGLK